MARRTRPHLGHLLVRGSAAVTLAAVTLTACGGSDEPAAAPGGRRPSTTTTTTGAPTTTTTAPTTTTVPTTTTAAPTTTTTAPASRVVPPAPRPAAATPPPPSPAPQSAAASSTGWEITVYVTPVERYYGGAPTAVSGCPSIECDRRTPKVPLGTYPADFVRRVKDEGTGLISSGAHAGRYLNWSYDTGYWLDTAPRDSYGNALVPYVSAAADGLPRGTRVRIVDCGRNDDGSAPDPQVCDAFQRAGWRIDDEFTPGLGGERHIDLYLGAEDRANYTGTSPFWVSLEGASLRY